MTYEEFKAAHAYVAPGEWVCHPIYGTGHILKAARDPFYFVKFMGRSGERTEVLAVSINVCGGVQ